MIITIDGPAASGKSTVAKKLAKELGLYFLSTGMMFRALAYLLIEKSSYQEDDFLSPREDDLSTYLDQKRFVYSYDQQSGAIIFFDGINITPFLKNQVIDAAASIISKNKTVRLHLLKLQRLIAKQFDLVAEGRDIGTVIFPNADCKFFLTASLHIRAGRWQGDQAKKGNHFSLNESVEMVRSRDERDMNRDIAPLKKADDAFKIDNSNMDLAQTVQAMIDIVQKKG